MPRKSASAAPAAMSTAVAVDPDRIQHLDPHNLIVDLDANVRVNTRLDEEFLASVRENGVQEPVTAVLTDDGAVRVERGHRRTLAARETGRDSIPVRVTGRASGTVADQVARIVRQVEENEQRAGLTVADHVKVATQLAALDLSPDQVARKTRRTRAQVDAALTVAQSQMARAVVVRYELDVVQAAVVAEFEDDPEAVKALVAAARTGQFEHVAQRARNQRVEAAAREAAAAPLRAAGLTIIGRPRWHEGPFRVLDELMDPATGDTITPETHATCPGHAAYLVEVWLDDPDDADESQDDDADATDDGQGGPRSGWEPEFGCLDPARHGHADRWGRGTTTAATGAEAIEDVTPQEQQARREATRAARRDVIDSNRAWEAAATVRRTWLGDLVGRKTAPRGAEAFLALSQASHPGTLAEVKGNHYAAELLGYERPGYGRSRDVQKAIAEAPSTRVRHLHLILTLAAYESATCRDDWRRPSATTRHYLAYLESIGYTLSPVEERALGRRDDLSD